jgi:hypothetical protein
MVEEEGPRVESRSHYFSLQEQAICAISRGKLSWLDTVHHPMLPDKAPNRSCLAKLPFLTAGGASLPNILLRIQPFHDAVHVECMRTPSPHCHAQGNKSTAAGPGKASEHMCDLTRWAVVPRRAAVRAARLKGRVTDPASLIIHVPSPRRNAMPTGAPRAVGSQSCAAYSIKFVETRPLTLC